MGPRCLLLPTLTLLRMMRGCGLCCCCCWWWVNLAVLLMELLAVALAQGGWGCRQKQKHDIQPYTIPLDDDVRR